MYRKLFSDVEKALNNFNVIILLGMRRTGKTVILKQLAEKYSGQYIDFRASNEPNAEFIDAFKNEFSLILLDEVGYLPDFDLLLANLDQEAGRYNKRFVITSSCYGALKQIGLEPLGAGRACILELFPLDFEEYLLFSGKISEYGQDYTPDSEDLQSYYRLSGLPAGMGFILNRDYLLGVYKDTEVATMNYQGPQRDILINEEQFTAVLDILAYSLNQQLPMKRFGGTRVAAQEFGAVKADSLNLSSSLIQIANSNANINYHINHMPITITPKEIGVIVAYLLHTGFVFVDLITNETGSQSASMIINDLLNVSSRYDLEAILSKYTISVISPLIYTRLMIDLELIANQVYDNYRLNGQLYELSIKAEDIKNRGFASCHYSYKYRNGNAEIDLVSGSLLLEAKTYYPDSHNLLGAYPGADLIRVLTAVDVSCGSSERLIYQIDHAEALLLLSNLKIYNLDPENKKIK